MGAVVKNARVSGEDGVRYEPARFLSPPMKSYYSRIADDGPDVQGRAGSHLGGPDDNHYAALGVQPIECIEAWSRTWPPEVAYHLGESVAMIARCGTKGQLLRDLRKACFLLERAVTALEDGAGARTSKPGEE